MAFESANTKTSSLSVEYDALAAQLADLRKDMSRLANSIGSAVESGGNTLARDVSDGLSGAATYVGRKTHAADMRVEHAVAANPYIALAIAAGAGLLLGAMTRR